METGPISHQPIPLRSRWKHQYFYPLDNLMSPLNSGMEIRNRIKKICDLFAFLSQIKPKNVKESLKDMDWINAMQENLHQFERSKSWHLLPRPLDRTIIGTRWVYRNKINEHKNTIRKNSRLVVQSYNK